MENRERLTDLEAEDDHHEHDSSRSSRFRAQTKAMGEDLKELGKIGRDVAGEKIGDARQAASDLIDQGRRRAGDLEDQLTDYVRAQPMKSLVVAVGIGALLGALLNRR